MSYHIHLFIQICFITYLTSKGNAYVLLAANVEDFREIAKKFVSGQVVDKIVSALSENKKLDEPKSEYEEHDIGLRTASEDEKGLSIADSDFRPTTPFSIQYAPFEEHVMYNTTKGALRYNIKSNPSSKHNIVNSETTQNVKANKPNRSQREIVNVNGNVRKRRPASVTPKKIEDHELYEKFELSKWKSDDYEENLHSINKESLPRQKPPSRTRMENRQANTDKKPYNPEETAYGKVKYINNDASYVEATYYTKNEEDNIKDITNRPELYYNNANNRYKTYSKHHLEDGNDKRTTQQPYSKWDDIYTEASEATRPRSNKRKLRLTTMRKKSLFVSTIPPKRERFSQSTPNYYIGYNPKTVDKYDFNEPLPERDRIKEEFVYDHGGNERINGRFME